MDTQQQALLGVLGGIGPSATVDFLSKLTRLTPATCDQDHLPWITVSQPGIDAKGPFLIEAVAWLANQGTKLIAIPCNTSHLWYAQMQAASSAPILHIADAVIEELQLSKAPMGAMAILASRSTVQAGIYSERLVANGFDLVVITEKEQTVVDQIIKDVKGGQVGTARDSMRALLQMLAERGAKTAILGCTELPIAFLVQADDSHSGMWVMDSSMALARVSLRRLGYV
ncbi:MAG: amino acid racemase [Pseudomonadota bacterium]